LMNNLQECNLFLLRYRRKIQHASKKLDQDKVCTRYGNDKKQKPQGAGLI
jgi:hypothetical protein